MTIETGDLRHILDYHQIVDYDINILQNCWDNIMKEYEQLSGQNDYSVNIKKINSRYSKLNNLNILKGCYLLMILGNNDCLNYLNAIGENINKISVENINKIRSKILAIQTRMEIEQIIKKEIEKEKYSYEEIIINIENTIGRNIRENITVAEYVAIIKAINKRNEEIKAHGRKN